MRILFKGKREKHVEERTVDVDGRDRRRRCIFGRVGKVV